MQRTSNTTETTQNIGVTHLKAPEHKEKVKSRTERRHTGRRREGGDTERRREGGEQGRGLVDRRKEQDK